MRSPFIMHLALTLVWLFLSGIPTLGNFLVALVATFILLSLFRRAIGCQDYVRRVSAFAVFVLRFLVEVIHSNVRIVSIALRRGAKRVKGCYVQYDVEGLSDLEVFLIAQCIGMSPGSMAAEREGKKYLILHCYPAAPAPEIQKRFDAILKRGILSFTR